MNARAADFPESSLVQNPTPLLATIVELAAAAMPAVERDRLDPEADLFRLGLDSTAAITLMLAIEARFGVNFPDALISEESFRSVRSLAAVVTMLKDRAGALSPD